MEQLMTRPQQNSFFSIIFIDGTIDDIAWSKSILFMKCLMIFPGKKTTFELGASSEELVGVGSDTGDEEQCSGDCY
jgi:hypothetical protein